MSQLNGLLPSMSQLHPIVVHFVIGLLFLGVLLRWISFAPKARFAGPAASLLLILGAIAAVLATESGDAAHRSAERIPGVRAAVDSHERWGDWARNIFLGVGILEVAALAIAEGRRHRALLTLSGILGIVGSVVLYEAGDRGGRLVYGYAAGVGTWSGDTADIDHLVTAGLHQQALLDRRAARPAEAAMLIRQLAARHPGDATVQLLSIESLIRDDGDPAAALEALRKFPPSPSIPSLRLGVGVLRVLAFNAAGMPDSAHLALQQLTREFPERLVRARMGGD